MKLENLLKRTAQSAAAVVLAVSLAACSTGAASDPVADTSEGTAATVNGKPVGEKIVSSYIANFRKASSLEEEGAWGEWLAKNGYTPAKVREEVINFYVDDRLLRQAAEEKGIKLEESAIDEEMAAAKNQFDSDEAWQKALEDNGMTEEEYRKTIVEPSMLQKALIESIASETRVTDEDVLKLAQQDASLLNDARRSSHILFNAEDTQLAQEVADKIKSGVLSFEEAAKTYSIDTASAANGGDVGWDALTTFDDNYQKALSLLEKGQVSDLVTSQYGIHLIKATDKFTVPEGGITSLDQLPSEIVDAMRASLSGDGDAEAFNTWFDEYRKGADIKVNDMPSGLAYDLDMAPYEKAEEEAKAAARSDQNSSKGSGSSGQEATLNAAPSDAEPKQ